MVNQGDFDSGSPDIARNNTFNYFNCSHGFYSPSLSQINEKLDKIIEYIGFDRQTPVPVSGDWADYYYDVFLKRKPETETNVNKAKSKPEKPNQAQLKYLIYAKIDRIETYLGVREQEYRFNVEDEYIPFRDRYRFKKGMNKWIWEF